MTEVEALVFETTPYFDPAVRLRRYDEQAKVEGVTIAPLEAYRELLVGLAVRA